MRTYGCALALILFFTTFSYSQDIPELTTQDSIVKSSWIVEVGINVVDDTGDSFGDFLTVKDQWNIVPFPSRISAERYFENGLGLALIATYNKYKTGNKIDGFPLAEDKEYYAIDSRLRYDLNKLIGETGWFEPYLGAGVGYTKANDNGRATGNAVMGFKIWLSDRFGIDLNTSGKWALENEIKNHIQHAAGIAYQFDIEKELSPKGKLKWAMIQDLEQEQQRVQDSIAAAQRAEAEAKALADRLQREKEAAERLAREKEVLLAQRRAVKEKIENLGNIYFSFNSSTLNNSSKTTLDQLIIILNQYKDIQLKVNAYTDSRGPDSYNQKLSQRRADNTVNYMVTQGIAKDRLESNGFGESKLLNECSNGVPCSAVKHKENRRSEFIMIEID